MNNNNMLIVNTKKDNKDDWQWINIKVVISIINMPL